MFFRIIIPGSSFVCFYVLQAPCCGKLYVCRLCHDAEENHQMDRFKVREVQCCECQTVQQVSEEHKCCHHHSPSLPAVAGPITSEIPQLLAMYLCLCWIFLPSKGSADLWAVPHTVWRVLLWYLPLVWQEQKAVSLPAVWNMQVSNSFSFWQNCFDHFYNLAGFHFTALQLDRKMLINCLSIWHNL